MAVLTGLPAPEIILGLRGVLDFYVHRGTTVARTWPRKPSGPRAPLVQLHIQAYVDYNRRLRAVDPSLVQQWTEATRLSTWTWHDAAISAIYGNANLS